jgi:NRPS condensation-like uncharacterized protein
MDFTAEPFDQLQRAFDLIACNDHQLHCVLRFDSGAAPEAAILRRAVATSIEAIPILGTRYVDGAKPRWAPLDPESCARAFVVARTQADFEAALVARAEEELGPQIKVCLLAGPRPAVALTLNHMICDAAGFKSYLYFLCVIYTRLLADPAYQANPVAGDRSMRRVLERFDLGVKLKSLFLQSGDNNQPGDQRFPMSEDEAKEPFILTRRLTRTRTAAIRDYGRTQGATLNDIVLTALYRCLFRVFGLEPGVELSIPIMVDMRRYLADGDEFTALTNLSSTVVTRLGREPGEEFAGTLGRVKAQVDAKKGADIGLNAFVKLDLLYRLFGDRIANRKLRAGLKIPFISMTNIGVLVAARLSFGDLRPTDAYLCGSIKYKPYFQLAMSSYRDELTFSVNLYGGAGDRARIRSFLEDIDAELPRQASSAETREAAQAQRLWPSKT